MLTKKVFIATLAGFSLVAVALTGCSTSSEMGSKAGPTIGVDALAVNTGTYVSQIQTFMSAKSHAPTTAVELKEALGGVQLPAGRMTTTYYVTSDGSGFCFISKSIGTTAVYDSTKGGEQPVGTLSCSADMKNIA